MATPTENSVKNGPSSRKDNQSLHRVMFKMKEKAMESSNAGPSAAVVAPALMITTASQRELPVLQDFSPGPSSFAMVNIRQAAARSTGPVGAVSFMGPQPPPLLAKGSYITATERVVAVEPILYPSEPAFTLKVDDAVVEKRHSLDGAAHRLSAIVLSPQAEIQRAVSFTRLKVRSDTVIEKPIFVSNYVRTARYTVWSFLPKQILFQFSKAANVYFAFIVSLQMIPGLSPTGRYTTLGPMLLFIILSMLREAYDDWKRHLQDDLENERLAYVLVRRDAVESRFVLDAPPPSFGYEDVPIDLHEACSIDADTTSNGQKQSKFTFRAVRWQDLVVGDRLLLRQNESVPADCVLLASDDSQGSCYVETASLDGETNLKQKQALSWTWRKVTRVEQLARLSIRIQAQSPNNDLYNFEGCLEVDQQSGELAGEEETFTRRPLTMNQLLLRGSQVRKSVYAYAVIVYTGEDTKIRRNANVNIKTKASVVDRSISNRIVVGLLGYVIFMAFISALLYRLFYRRLIANWWYLDNKRQNDALHFFGFIVLYNTVVPLSLYVTLESVKLGQAFLMNSDLKMYDERSDTPAEARTSSLNEDLGQVSYLFSDKTGTLTENQMRIRYFTSGGLLFRQMDDGTGKPSVTPLEEQRVLEGSIPSHSLVNDIWQQIHSADDTSYPLDAFEDSNESSIVQFLESMALCHTVLPSLKNSMPMNLIAKSPSIFSVTAASIRSGMSPRHANVQLLTTLSNGNAVPLDLNATKEMACDARSILSKDFSSVPASPPPWQETEYVDLEFNAMSPDEEALLNAARALHFTFYQKTLDRITVDICHVPVHYQILDVLQFTSSRKRMSTIYRMPNGELKLFCKGADNVILERLSKEQSSILISTTMRHIDEMAQQGLRTLLFTSKSLSEEFYKNWKQRYDAANLLLVDRQKILDELSEEVENDLLLLGGTGIEDELQVGVPETIDQLRRAGIAVWVLTGDKRETVINIAKCSSIIKSHSQVWQFERDENTLPQKEFLDQCLAETVKKVTSNQKMARNVPLHQVLVVDGAELSVIEKEKFHLSFLLLASYMDTVICCRVSPQQKALMVRWVREHMQDIEVGSKSNFISRLFRIPLVTCAIGDGANDISMIQEAQVGIGMTGKEGLQAARAADYSIAQFRFLQRLLLVHGHWSYLRISEFMLATFYKSVTFFSSHFFFNAFAAFSGVSMFESWTLSLYNVLWAVVVIVVIGLIDRDNSAGTLMKHPELYHVGPHHELYSVVIFLRVLFNSILHSMLISLITVLLVRDRSMENHGLDTLYGIGTIVYSVAIIVINVKMGYLMTRSWLYWTQFFVWGTIFVWFCIYQPVYSLLFYGRVIGWDVSGLAFALYSTPQFALIILLLSVTCLLPDWTWLCCKRLWWPDDCQIFLESGKLKGNGEPDEHENGDATDNDALIQPSAPFETDMGKSDYAPSAPANDSHFGFRQDALIKDKIK